MIDVFVVACLVLVCWIVIRSFQKSDDDVVSPLPLLGCALAFKNDTVRFLCGLAERGQRAVTLNLAGLRLRLLLDPTEVAKSFYRAREVFCPWISS